MVSIFIVPPLSEKNLIQSKCLWAFICQLTWYIYNSDKNLFFYLKNVLRSWVHKISMQFRTFSPRLEDIDLFYVVLTVFHIDHISELHFDVSLFSNHGEKVLKRHITMEKIRDRFSGPSPCNWRTTIHWNVVLTVLHTPWDMWSLWKTVETTLKCIKVLQSGGEGPKLH